MDDELKDKALQAARAATMSAALVGATACSEPDTTQEVRDGGGWNVGDNDRDVSERTDDDVSIDTGSDALADTSPDTNDTLSCEPVSDDTCPSFCTRENDADCCEQNRRCRWTEESGCGCAVPGPFVPPAIA